MPTQGLSRMPKSAVIARAKREWQCVVDALPQFVCLLNRGARIVRSNRVAEQWGLRRVHEVAGLTLHELLHPACGSPGCPLLASLAEAWRLLESGGESAGFDLYDGRLGRWLKALFRRMPTEEPAVERGATGGNCAVCIIEDVTTLRLAEEGQRELNQQLETRVEERTCELSVAVAGLKAEVLRRQSAEQSLRDSRNELSLLSGQLMKAQEIERKRIAQDLHDAVGQSLSAIKYSLERVQQMIETPSHGSPLPVLATTVGIVQRTIEDVRTISENLRPAVLDTLGAVSAIRWLCREWSEVFSGIEVEINLHITDADVHEPIGTALFRSVQESLNNVARHSKASLVRVSVFRESDFLRLDVADNGVGFEPESDSMRHGHGLRGIRERVTAAGGEFLLTSYPGGGTQLLVSWPCAARESSEPLLCVV